MKSDHKTRRIILMILAMAVAGLAVIVQAKAAFAQFGPLGGPQPVAISGIGGWILAKQAMFYQTLAGMIRSAKSNGTALWSLMGVSFIYGIFHAAGPGHGKAVISSYLVANEETWLRGITLSFAAAVIQSTTAIVIVGVAAVLLGATAKLMSDTVNLIETVGYVLIVLLGARLMWVKGRGFLGALQDLKAERNRNTPDVERGSHIHDADCGYDHSLGFIAIDGRGATTMVQPAVYQCHGDHHRHAELDVLPWGHAHGPEPRELAGPQGWRHGLPAVVAVGLRPCSGAIIVLVFALAQGLFWAGVASTFVMGLGTAITVGGAASLAIGAKELAKRITQKPLGRGGLVMRGLEFGTAGLVFAFGLLLLTGYMASERMGLF
ncbi:MAG: nickel/cobalt transporter [Xanthobacteraceae bacterium]